MQNPPRQKFFRRLLFPYSGVEALTFKQCLRVLLAWMVLVPLSMSLCTLLLTAIFSYPLEKISMAVLFTFLSAFFIFGGLGVLAVITNNSSARIRQRQKTIGMNDTTGGRNGS